MSETESFLDYQNNAKTKSAVERQLAIIGEAINQFRKIEHEYQLTHTRQIIDLRNRLIHAYDSIDDTIIWTIVRKHLPILAQEVIISLGQTDEL